MIEVARVAGVAVPPPPAPPTPPEPPYVPPPGPPPDPPDPVPAGFIPLGWNMLGPHNKVDSSAVTTVSCVSVIKNDWGCTAIRLITSPTGLSGPNDDLDAIITAYTAADIVVILDFHQVTAGQYSPSGPGDTIITTWTAWANAYKDNPLVWFEVQNEPGSESPVSPQWNTLHRNVIAAIRATGATNPIVLDDSAWGQGSFSGGTGYVQTYNSGLLTYMPGILADYGPNGTISQGDLLGSFHVYDQWNASGGTDAKMADYIDRNHANGVPLFVGEAGTIGYVNDGVADFTAAFDTVIRVCLDRGVGVIGWFGQSKPVGGMGEDEGFNPCTTGTRGVDAINDPDNPTNLTHEGAGIFALTHA